MKKILPIIILALSAQGFAEIYKAAELVKDCNGPAGSYQQSFALGFIKGIAENMSESVTMAKNKPKDVISWIPAYEFHDATTGIMKDSVCKWINDRPEIWWEPAHKAVSDAVNAMYKNPEAQ